MGMQGGSVRGRSCLGAPKLPALCACALLLLSAIPRVALQSPDGAPQGWVCAPGSGPLCQQNPRIRGLFRVSILRNSMGGLISPKHYITGSFAVRMQLPRGNSGGTALAFGVFDTGSAGVKDPRHAEISMTFNGNRSARTVMLSTNIYAGGRQNLAQFRLPFDPSLAFHSYTIRWGATQISWLIDGVPIRVLPYNARRPWPVASMRPQVFFSPTPWTPLQPDYRRGPIGALVQGVSQQGCLSLDIEEGVPGRARCPGDWNRVLPASLVNQGLGLGRRQQIVAYNWDRA